MSKLFSAIGRFFRSAAVHAAAGPTSDAQLAAAVAEDAKHPAASSTPEDAAIANFERGANAMDDARQ